MIKPTLNHRIGIFGFCVDLFFKELNRNTAQIR
jgi:hypothetical protein